jgi:SAM-dependent methyltransferase
MDKVILFVSHKESQCGVYEFGRHLTNILQRSKRYRFKRVECSSLDELNAAISLNTPNAIIYNYMPTIMPWVVSKVFRNIYLNNLSSLGIPQIGLIHDVTQDVADLTTNYRNKFFMTSFFNLTNSLFDYYIAADPTLILRNPLVYKTGRLIPSYQNNFPQPSKLVIGSFGFGTPNKGFEKIILLVQNEFNEAIIRFNIPAADFGDKDGINAKAIADKCKGLISKPGIRLNITHDYLDNNALLDFLAQNTMNIFLYEDKSNRGISSALDNAMAVRRPIAVSDGTMFRHIFNAEPSVRITHNNLQNIIKNGFRPLEKYYNEWNSHNILWEYERIFDSIFNKRGIFIESGKNYIKTLKSVLNRGLLKPVKTFSWYNPLKILSEDDMKVDNTITYYPVQLPYNASLNRILDNDARQLYKPAITKLSELLPITMARKIANANVQQAFVFDTVYRFLDYFRNPKLLCVGSHEDTASMGLRKMGYTVEEIDPVNNYYLQEYVTKPTTGLNSYDIIFATSVIEHDPEDASFIKCMAQLLAPGGFAIITCDFKDEWKQGEPIPEGNLRFYSKSDLLYRLLPLMENCNLVDEPQWECPNPDFNYLGKYQYTFATFVVKKYPN